MVIFRDVRRDLIWGFISVEEMDVLKINGDDDDDETVRQNIDKSLLFKQ